MKKTYLIAIVLIGVAIALLVNAADDMGTYATFSEAKADAKVKIAGQLIKDKEMYYNPEKDPNYFSFYIRDTKGDEHKVVLLSEKPQDFELSEQIVVTGSLKGNEFVATDVLLKCPSKYKDEEVYMKKES